MGSRAMCIICDGWGIGKVQEADAIAQADTPFFDQLLLKYPHCTLTTFGKLVGLPEGQMGNSEVGHLNLGAGRIVSQELTRIDHAIEDGTLAKNPVLLSSLNNSPCIHLLGLMSKGGVHSHMRHALALIKIIRASSNIPIYVHAILDGRDCDPQSGVECIEEFLREISNDEATQLASLIGRYYAMDRDHRWERIKLAYDVLVHGTGTFADDPLQSIQNSYDQNITDEFLLPLVCSKNSGSRIKSGDTVLFFNFRTDRPRQLVEVLCQHPVEEQKMFPLELNMITMTRYDDHFKNVQVIFESDNLKNTLGEYLSKLGKTQLRIAETEKYPHVTYFFSGGQEQAFPGEERILIPSPKVATYDLAPAMSAQKVTEAALTYIAEHRPDFVCLNYANTDMVGHTGVFEAAVQAAETVDTCLSQIIPLALEHDYAIIVLADHGNSDYMINPDGTPNTAHTMNPVPCIIITPKSIPFQLNNGKLADIAPTICTLLEIPIPGEMTGASLLQLAK